jgi:3-oxoacyl-[acyl-carrier-protein] synthase II
MDAMKAAICGIGVVGGFGCGLPALETALNGNRIEPTIVSVPTRSGPVRVPCLTADTGPLAGRVPPRALRRMSHYIRLGLLASLEAMIDAGILDKARRGRLGIIVATGHGATGNNYDFQYPFEDKEEICGSPIRFSNSVHNAAAAHISIALEEMGPNHSITHGDLSFPSALLTALAWLARERVDAVIVGGVDELNHAHAYAWHAHRMKRPKDVETVDRVPLAGEGACFFVLKPHSADASPYGIIREVVLSRDIGGPIRRPPSECTILGRGGLAATPVDYDRWLPAGACSRCYADIYGDLPVDSAFDTAIAALSLKNNRIYTDGRKPDPSGHHEPAASRPIACLKLGVGDTYAWTLMD